MDFVRASGLFILAVSLSLAVSFSRADNPAAPAKSGASDALAATSGLNEMRGKLVSKSDDPRMIRISADGGINIEFAYDAATVMINGGKPVTVDDLNYGDELLIRYSGKELKAVVIDRVSKAARPQ
jgi:hypothetical protein